MSRKCAAAGNDVRADRGRSAFTLVELLSVIAIIGILAGLIIGIAGYASRKADRGKAISEMQKLKNALEEYRVVRGQYPDLSSQTAVADGSFWTNLVATVPPEFLSGVSSNDPWGNSYWYQRESRFQYKLWSTGPDALDDSDNVDSGSGEL
jgi:type II secretion system protein G